MEKKRPLSAICPLTFIALIAVKRRIPSGMNNPTRNSAKIYNELPSDDAHTGWPLGNGFHLSQDVGDHSVGDESDPNELFITYAEHGRRQ